MIYNALHPDSNVHVDIEALDTAMPLVDDVNLKARLSKLGNQMPRIFKSHEPFSPQFLKGKCVYIVRDGRDAVMSFYNYRQKMNNYVGDFSSFLRRVTRGGIRYGSWHDHVAGWMKHEGNPSMLVLRYEHMLQDPGEQLRKALEHFGIHLDSDTIEKAVAHSSLDKVNRGFQTWAASRSKSFEGGLGGGSGKGKTMDEQDTAFFMQSAGRVMAQMGYGTVEKQKIEQAHFSK